MMGECQKWALIINCEIDGRSIDIVTQCSVHVQSNADYAMQINIVWCVGDNIYQIKLIDLPLH